VKCYSCNKPKNELQPKKSELLDGVTSLMCQTCIESRFEPRWIVVLAGRSRGASYVRDFVIKHRYVGDEILANELIA
jgi:hypothetical protein